MVRESGEGEEKHSWKLAGLGHHGVQHLPRESGSQIDPFEQATNDETPADESKKETADREARDIAG